MNIVLNALEAMHGNGTLTLTTRVETNQVVVDIEDTGVGIPEGVFDRIFDPFFSTKQSTEGVGTGLGLAVSYGIVQRHGGDIRVTSKVGVGTKFSIVLPVQT